MWNLLGPGIKPVSPALAGGFLTTAPPGKSLKSFKKLQEKEERRGEEELVQGEEVPLTGNFCFWERELI